MSKVKGLKLRLRCFEVLSGFNDMLDHAEEQIETVMTANKVLLDFPELGKLIMPLAFVLPWFVFPEPRPTSRRSCAATYCCVPCLSS